MHEIQMNKSGSHRGAENLKKLLGWIEERYRLGDWDAYIRGGKLNRTEIATECGFARSVFAQNPAIRTAVEAMETDLRGRDILNAISASKDAINDVIDANNEAVERRILISKQVANQRLKSLEEQNAALRAEVRDLKIKLRQLNHIEEHLSSTGRMISP